MFTAYFHDINKYFSDVGIVFFILNWHHSQYLIILLNFQLYQGPMPYEEAAANLMSKLEL